MLTQLTLQNSRNRGQNRREQIKEYWDKIDFASKQELMTFMLEYIWKQIFESLAVVYQNWRMERRNGDGQIYYLFFKRGKKEDLRKTNLVSLTWYPEKILNKLGHNHCVSIQRLLRWWETISMVLSRNNYVKQSPFFFDRATDLVNRGKANMWNTCNILNLSKAFVLIPDGIHVSKLGKCTLDEST